MARCTWSGVGAEPGRAVAEVPVAGLAGGDLPGSGAVVFGVIGLLPSNVAGLKFNGLPVASVVFGAGAAAGTVAGGCGIDCLFCVAGGVGEMPVCGTAGSGVPPADDWPAGTGVPAWEVVGLLPGQLRTSWISFTRLAL